MEKLKTSVIGHVKDFFGWVKEHKGIVIGAGMLGIVAANLIAPVTAAALSPDVAKASGAQTMDDILSALPGNANLNIAPQIADPVPLNEMDNYFGNSAASYPGIHYDETTGRFFDESGKQIPQIAVEGDGELVNYGVGLGFTTTIPSYDSIYDLGKYTVGNDRITPGGSTGEQGGSGSTGESGGVGAGDKTGDNSGAGGSAKPGTPTTPQTPQGPEIPPGSVPPGKPTPTPTPSYSSDSDGGNIQVAEPKTDSWMPEVDSSINIENARFFNEISTVPTGKLIRVEHSDGTVTIVDEQRAHSARLSDDGKIVKFSLFNDNYKKAGKLLGVTNKDGKFVPFDADTMQITDSQYDPFSDVNNKRIGVKMPDGHHVNIDRDGGFNGYIIRDGKPIPAYVTVKAITSERTGKYVANIDGTWQYIDASELDVTGKTLGTAAEEVATATPESPAETETVVETATAPESQTATSVVTETPVNTVVEEPVNNNADTALDIDAIVRKAVADALAEDAIEDAKQLNQRDVRIANLEAEVAAFRAGLNNETSNEAESATENNPVEDKEPDTTATTPNTPAGTQEAQTPVRETVYIYDNPALRTSHDQLARAYLDELTENRKLSEQIIATKEQAKEDNITSAIAGAGLGALLSGIGFAVGSAMSGQKKRKKLDIHDSADLSKISAGSYKEWLERARDAANKSGCVLANDL